MSPQRHAFLILAHDEPVQLAQLLELLDADGNDVYLQASTVGTVNPSRYRMHRASLTALEPFPVHWGASSQIEAVLRLLEHSTADGHHDWYHMLTGADLPLVSQEELNRRLSGRSNEFLQLAPELAQSARWRVVYRHLFVESDLFRRSKAVRLASRAGVRAQRALRAERRLPEGMVLTAGSAYFTISHAAALSVLDHRNWIDTAFRRSIAGDEVFLTTILANNSFRDRISTQGPDGEANLRYIDWHRGVGDSPHVFTFEDLAEIREASKTKLFARKFKRSVDPTVVDHIVTALLEGRPI